MMTTTTVALCLGLLGSALSTPAPTPSGCWKQWYCTGETSDTAYYCGDTAPCSFTYVGCNSAGYSDSCTPVLGEVSGGTCADMVSPWGSEYVATKWYCDADVCGAAVCAELESEGCYKYWDCVGEGDGNEYYCDQVGEAPCSIAYTGCETIIEDDIDGTGCKMTFGESKGGTCATMSSPWGDSSAKGMWHCTGAAGCDCEIVSAAGTTRPSLVAMVVVAAVATMLTRV